MTARHFGITSRSAEKSTGASNSANARISWGSPVTSGPAMGAHPPARSHMRDAILPRNSNLLPASPPLERSQIAQALIDCLAVVFGIFFLCSVACSLPLAIFIMFFVGV